MMEWLQYFLQPPNIAFVDESPNIFDSHSILFVIGLLLYPRLTLLIASKIQWSIWWFLFVSFTPEESIILIAFAKGYFRRNYLLVTFYILKTFFTSKKYLGIRQELLPGQRNRSQSTIRNDPNQSHNFQQLVLVANLLQGTIQELEDYKEKFQRAFRELQLLRADPSRMSNLTLLQLEELKEYMKKNLTDVENWLSKISKSSQKPIQEAVCIICRTNPPSMVIKPCLHTCICSDCYDNWTMSQTSDCCPICRTAILDTEFDVLNGVAKVPRRTYHSNSVSATVRELVKLQDYLKSNPQHISNLEHRDEMEHFLHTGDHLQKNH